MYNAYQLYIHECLHTQCLFEVKGQLSTTNVTNLIHTGRWVKHWATSVWVNKRINGILKGEVVILIICHQLLTLVTVAGENVENASEIWLLWLQLECCLMRSKIFLMIFPVVLQSMMKRRMMKGNIGYGSQCVKTILAQFIQGLITWPRNWSQSLTSDILFCSIDEFVSICTLCCKKYQWNHAKHSEVRKGEQQPVLDVSKLLFLSHACAKLEYRSSMLK